jgi:iron(III) transport system permease protein
MSSADASVVDARNRTAAWRRFDWLQVSALTVVVGLSLVIAGLIGVVVWLSFVQGMPGVDTISLTLDNFRRVYTDTQTFYILRDTTGFALVTVAVAVIFGLPTAWLCERTDLPGKSIVFTLMTISLLTPGFASAMGWTYLLHVRIGLVNIFLRNLFGFTTGPFNIGTLVGMGWVQGLGLAPVVFIMTAAIFRAIDPSLEESAQMCGARPWQTLLKITLRLVWPGIVAASIYAFTIGFAAFDVPAMIGWGNRLYTFSTYLVLMVQPEGGMPTYGLAAALSAVILVFAFLLSWWYARLIRHTQSYSVVTGKGYRPSLLTLGWRSLPAWLGLGIYFFLAQLIPIVVVVWASLIPFFQLPTARALRQASLSMYVSLPWDLVMRGVTNTGILMVLAPALTLVFSVAFSWIVLRSRIRGRSFFDIIAFVPHAVPNIIFSLALLLTVLYGINRVVPLYGTIWILLIISVIGRISYGTRMTNNGLIQIHRELEESARMSGASNAVVMGRVIVPLLAPTLFYAWLWMALLTAR